MNTIGTTDANIDPSLQDAQHSSIPPQPQMTPPHQITPPHTQESTSANASPQKRRRASRSRKSVDLEGGEVVNGDHASPKAKRARPSPRVKNPTPVGVPQNEQAHLISIPEFAHQTTSPGIAHMIPQAYPAHAQQPPTAPMNYVPQLHQAAPLTPMPKKVLPPKHDTPASLTDYLSLVFSRSSASFTPPTINTSFTLPWSFRIPREAITVPTSPGPQSFAIRDLLCRLAQRTANETGEPNPREGEDKEGSGEMEALVSMAKKSLDVQNILTEVAISLVKIVQGVDGFVYAMSAASRVPLLPGDRVNGTSRGLLGGDWDFTFVCTCSEEAKALPEQARVISSGENADAQAVKHVACEGRILIGFLEEDETVILKYRHCALHRPSGEIIQYHTPGERTIVGGVVSRKAPNASQPQPQPQPQQQHPNGAAAYPASTYYGAQPQQHSNGYVLVNGQWFYPQPTPPVPYQQPGRHQHITQAQYQQPITHADPLPDGSMQQIYSAAIAQYGSSSKRKGRPGSISDGSSGHATSTEQRLYEMVTRELNNHPQHAPQGGEVKQEQPQVHHGTQEHDQQQGYDYQTGYTYPSTTAYAHNAVTPLAGGAELGNVTEVGVEGGQEIEGGTNMVGHEQQGHATHEQVQVQVQVPAVETDPIVKELVQQLVANATAAKDAAAAAAAAAATVTTSPPPVGNESPETKRRRGRVAKS